MLTSLKLRNRMLIYILGINSLILITVFLVYFGFSKKTVIQQTKNLAMEQVKHVATTLDGHLEEKAKVGWTICQLPTVVQWIETNERRNEGLGEDTVYQHIMTIFDKLANEDEIINTVFMSSEKAQFYWDNRGDLAGPEYRVGARPWYINAVKANAPSFDVSNDYTTGKTLVNTRCPIRNESGTIIGIGGIDISLDDFDKTMQSLNLFESGQTILFDSEGLILYHPDKNFVLKKRITEFEDDGTQFKNMDRVASRILNREEGIEEVIFNGKKQYFLFSQVATLNGTMALTVERTEFDAPLKKLATTTFIILLSTAAVLILFVILFTASITNPIKKIVSMVNNVAEGEGDLTRRLNVESQDEIGDLAQGFNRFISKLHNIIFEVRSNTEMVAAAALDISSTSAELASGAEEQDVQTSEVATSVQEMTAAIVENSQNAARSAEIAKEASNKASEGSDVMQATLEGMEEIVMSTSKTGQVVQTLTDRTSQIGDIIQVINDIADQTNLLALNAAIEAARAGEQGRGFAVVADEVRKLAERTTKATHEIAETIEAIQQDTGEASTSMNNVRDVVNRGKEMAIKTGSVLRDIIESVNGAMDMISQIAAASEQMSTGAEEISRNIESISIVTRESATGAEQMAGTADRLSDQTGKLTQLVNRFKLKDSNASKSDQTATSSLGKTAIQPKSEATEVVTHIDSV